MACFFMLCNERTEAECLERLLFGDRAWRIDAMKSIEAGDAGFLFNISADELLGVFRAVGPPAMSIVRAAWKGQYPAQVRVEQVGTIQRVPKATPRLQKVMEMRILDAGRNVFLVPGEVTFGPEVETEVLGWFRDPEAG